MPTRGNWRKIGVRVDSRPVAVAAPERRVRAEREQHGDVDAHPVGDVDRLVGVVDADVDVHAEDELLARDEAQRGDEVAVARARDDPLVLPHRERVRARPSRSSGRARARRLAHLARAASAAGSPASAVFAHGFVAISSTDSMSSGLSRRVAVEVGGAVSSSSDSIALTSA